jgi:hypothetical protein
LIATMPLLSGAFLQLISTEALRAVKNHKVWVWSLAFLQALTFVPLVFFASGARPHFLTLFLLLTFYWGAGFSISPAWNYWMGNLVSSDQAQKFFSQRSRISQVGLLLGLIIGGVALHNDVHLGPFTSAFGLIFFIAFCARTISSWLLAQKHYEDIWTVQASYLHLQESFQIFWRDRRKRNFFLSLLPFQMAVFFSAPFVTPYLLAQIKMNYGQYMAAVAFLMVGKILSTLYFERTSDVHYREAFKWGLVVIAPAPYFWIFSDHFYYILILQLISGAAYGFFEVGLALIFFKDLKADEKIPFLTFYNFLNCLGLLVGSAFGGVWLKTQNSTHQAYAILFIVGATLRIFASRILWLQAKQMHQTDKTIATGPS